MYQKKFINTCAKGRVRESAIGMSWCIMSLSLSSPNICMAWWAAKVAVSEAMSFA